MTLAGCTDRSGLSLIAGSRPHHPSIDRIDDSGEAGITKVYDVAGVELSHSVTLQRHGEHEVMLPTILIGSVEEDVGVEALHVSDSAANHCGPSAVPPCLGRGARP